MIRAVLLLVLLAGCGEPTVTSRIDSGCPADCLGPMTAEVAIDCAVWGANVNLAGFIAADAGIIPAGEFCDRDIPVHIANVDSFDDGSLSHTTFGYVTLSRRGIHLLHERLHLWDEAHFVFNPGHVAWDSNGYRAADYAFREQSTKYVPFEPFPATP